MAWQGHLQIDYRRDADRTVALDLHHGPLRVLQRLYPEGPGICHHVLVHPPGGIVGGDSLTVDLRLAAGSHALLTTPGATRFYRSDGAPALQHVHATLCESARLEWLPLETIAYSGCMAENHFRFDLAPGAEMMGWDMLALGLPAAGAGFQRGSVLQHLNLPGVWLERGRISAQDQALLGSPLGLAGHTVLASLWFAAGSPMSADRRETLLERAREQFAASPLNGTAGATSPDGQVVVCRVLAGRVEPVFALWRAVRAAWREVAWGLPASPLRLWST